MASTSDPTMQFGVMQRGVFEWDDDMGAHFSELMEQAQVLDKLGYDSITTGSHFSTYPHREFMQVPYLCRVMAEAPNLRLNAGIVLLSLHNPLEVAENFAAMDVMSGGRIIFGCALGYRDVEYKGFGVKKGEGVARFEENLEAVKRLWTEERVSMTGSHFELDEAVVSLPLVQRPHPPIWIGANADNAIRRAARLGDCWYLNPHQKLETFVRQMEIYRGELDRLGKPFPDEFPMRREVFCARSHDEAIKIAAPYIKKQYDLYKTWGQDKAMAKGDQDIAMDYEDLARDRFIVGDPDEVAAEMLRYHNALGVNHIIMSVQGVGMPQGQVLDTFQLMAEEVFPKVRDAL
ncbi:MAG: LLM class flavin-dependent oxidoreductase [Rhodospirillaceae bacterium]|jgi:alkanesulfonate monooxygenase SsuD/methylene tetrahydromethanopterin reductase-like flavin-dependent oxidoreductase (luciferase family)|nr:LLM class flavin-dependent oxidoreductase [Rhodospirillaceae bacterium]MBT4686847.1 LLM class flavin-dependent oxidoreductase [Rhodospirillaceae bacterium]MBT5079422.1 LLM class flavin-dependent oxidoreductase [Rhodospirillaceae bacterium]MBT5526336.1 LLM class flavin-dependent oxidoreductase [Rhodospirillaceae bacterium]MBT5881576.1 LLM class flavin-dependent oxidoreductase [Rhodospirillaceae bacterium]